MRINTCSSFTTALIGLLIATFLDTLKVSAWSIAGGGVTTTTGMTPSMSTRRLFVKSAAISISSAAAGAIVQPAQASAVSNKADLIEDLRVSKEKLQAIPALLEEKEWDKVRSILKLPPVNKLWNLGDVSA